MPRKYLQPPYIVRYSFQDSEHEWPIPRVEHEKESPDHLQEGGQRLALASIDLTILDSAKAGEKSTVVVLLVEAMDF
jgi:hypothetical protein